MLNTVKPVHINIGDGTAASGVEGNAAVGTPAGLIPQLYAYEAVPAAGANALRITVPGMGAGVSSVDPSANRSPGRRATWLTVANLDTTDNLQISFDNGNNFFTIGAGAEFTAAVRFRHFFLRAATTAATNIQEECIVGINQT